MTGEASGLDGDLMRWAEVTNSVWWEMRLKLADIITFSDLNIYEATPQGRRAIYIAFPTTLLKLAKFFHYHYRPCVL